MHLPGHGPRNLPIALVALALVAPCPWAADGAPDPAFGRDDGISIVHPPRADVAATANDLALTPTGTIVVGGDESIHNRIQGHTDRVFHAELLNSRGDRVGAFGPIESDFGTIEQSAQAIATDPAGRIYLAGAFAEVELP